MTSDFDYKKYSLEKLQEWVHDALSCGEASPHEIYSAIREAVQEDYQYYKDHSARAFGLLELLSGHRPVAEKDDGMRPWGHSDLEYQYTATGEKFHLSCDKDDPSLECKKSWNDFWEENYYPEEYQGSSVSSVNLKKEIEEIRKQGGYEWTPEPTKKTWILPVEEVRDEDTDEDIYFVTFPDDLLDAADLKEGDIIEWVNQGDGSYLLKKVEKWTDPYKEQMLNAGYEMVDGVWTLKKVSKPLGMDEC